jgi:hypothetical protein
MSAVTHSSSSSANGDTKRIDLRGCFGANVAKSNYICTWIYAESASEGGIYPQLGRTSTGEAQNVYWRCVAVFFETARRALVDPQDYRLLLFTNLSTLPVIDGMDIGDFLRKLGVEVITIDYTWKPAGSRRIWLNQYYIFDIFDRLDHMLGEEDAAIVADCDCVFVRDPASLFEIMRRDGVLLIEVEETQSGDDDINGLSRSKAIDVYECLGDIRPQVPPIYFGGECYGMTRNTLTSVTALARVVKPANDKLAKTGHPYLSDEAHFFSYLMWKLGYLQPNGNGCIRRIWTSWKYNTTRAQDLELAVWHLPSEKTLGFRLVYDGLRSWPQSWTQAENLAWLADKMGVGRKSILKFATHLAQAIRNHLVPAR